MVMRLSQKRPFLVFPQMCVKPRKSNVSGFPSPRFCRFAAGEPSELDEPRLVGVQFQTELREPLAKVGEEPLRIGLMLEPGHKVVGEPRDDHITVGVPSSPLPDPPVEDVVEIDVGKQGRG